MKPNDLKSHSVFTLMNISVGKLSFYVIFTSLTVKERPILLSGLVHWTYEVLQNLLEKSIFRKCFLLILCCLVIVITAACTYTLTPSHIMWQRSCTVKRIAQPFNFFLCRLNEGFKYWSCVVSTSEGGK